VATWRHPLSPAGVTEHTEWALANGHGTSPSLGRGRPSAPADVIAVGEGPPSAGRSFRPSDGTEKTDTTWKVRSSPCLYRGCIPTRQCSRWYGRSCGAVIASSGVIAKKNCHALDASALDDAMQRKDRTKRCSPPRSAGCKSCSRGSASPSSPTRRTSRANPPSRQRPPRVCAR
jgi:hypothetical protein